MQACNSGEISNVEQGMKKYEVNEECVRYFNIHDSLPSGLYDLAKV